MVDIIISQVVDTVDAKGLRKHIRAFCNRPTRKESPFKGTADIKVDEFFNIYVNGDYQGKADDADEVFHYVKDFL